MAEEEEEERDDAPQRIGEGAYGCVFAPPIRCRDRGVSLDYSRHVSKLMKAREAREEMQYFRAIGEVDPDNEYYMGKPVVCTPAPVREETVRACKHTRFSSRDMNAHPEKYSLIMMVNGGKDLKETMRQFTTQFPSPRLFGRFWEQTMHLLRGLQRFREGGFVHFDIKSHNVVFDPASGAMRFIDFGLSGRAAEIARECAASRYALARYHFNYPIECGLLNRADYERFVALDEAGKDLYVDSMVDMMMRGNLETNNPMHIPHLSNTLHQVFASLFDMIDPTRSAEFKTRFIRECFAGIREAVRQMSHEEFVERVLRSVDIYGMGATLQYVFLCIVKHLPEEHPLRGRPDVLEAMHEVFYTMYAPSILKRQTDIDALIRAYEPVLAAFLAACPQTGGRGRGGGGGRESEKRIRERGGRAWRATRKRF